MMDRMSWKVKNEATLAELIRLMNLSEEEAAILKSLQPRAVTQAPRMTEDFYARLFAHQETAEYLAGISMERLHSMLQTWFVELFGGVYDEAYAQRRLKIGQKHAQIGLPIRYPLAMLDVTMAHGEVIAREHPQPDAAMRALRKVLSLDVAVFSQAYEDQQLRALTEVVGDERLARRLLTSV